MSETKNTETYRRAETLFMPMQRPLLRQVPDAAMARSFLKEVERYQKEVEIRMKVGESAEKEADPLWFFLETYLLNFLRESEESFPDDRDVAVTDLVIRSWLESVAKIDDGRSLSEILAEVAWPRAGGNSTIRRYNNRASTIGGSDRVVIQGVLTLERAAQIFRMEVGRVLDDHHVLERFTEKRVVKELVTKCPAPIQVAIREHFGLKIGEESKKSLTKFWKLVISATKVHDEARRHVAGISFLRGESRAVMHADFAYHIEPGPKKESNQGVNKGGRITRDMRGGGQRGTGGNREHRGGRLNRVPFRSAVFTGTGNNYGSKTGPSSGSTGTTAAGAASTGGSSTTGGGSTGISCYTCGMPGNYARKCIS